MIKFIGYRNGRRFLGIVITEANVQKLKENLPMHFSAEEMKIPKIDVQEIAIFYAPTEKEFYDMAKEHGLVTDKTIIHKEGNTKQ